MANVIVTAQSLDCALFYYLGHKGASVRVRELGHPYQTTY